MARGRLPHRVGHRMAPLTSPKAAERPADPDLTVMQATETSRGAELATFSRRGGSWHSESTGFQLADSTTDVSRGDDCSVDGVVARGFKRLCRVVVA